MSAFDLRLDGVSKRFGAQEVLRGVSFTAAAGRVTGFVGRNGAGKTTALKVLLGLTRAESGSASIGGRPSHEVAPGQVGVLLDPAFHPGRSGRSHLTVAAAALGLGRADVDAVLDQVDLTGAAGKRIGGYSLGMKQRLGLAAALLGRPQALVLDEPVNGLDPDGIAWLRGLLRAEAARGVAVLISSHLLAELQSVADDLVVLDREVLWTGSVQDAVAGAGHGGLEAFFHSVTAKERAA